MSSMVFFLEEPSAEEFLQGLLPRILPADVILQFVVFEGKQDLEKRLPQRLKAWQDPNAQFVVMRDKDAGDCLQIKAKLLRLCGEAGKPDCLIRIACHELESFFLGDLAAVAQAFGLKKLGTGQKKAKFRVPDALANPAEELKKLVPTYQKRSGSRAMGAVMGIDNNCSHSFNALILGIQRLAGVQP